jgi:4-hydroxy-tetrahydrodipicolinate synthase
MLYAFFDRQGRLDREAMGRQVETCVSCGVHGIAVLGLATEVGKLAPDERRRLVEWASADLAGQLPLAVTIAPGTVEEQVEFAAFARDRGAGWVILQPPADRSLGEKGLTAFFGAVADRAPLPVAIQNAPEYLGVGLSPAGIARLAAEHPNVRLVKGEGPAVAIRAVIEAVGDRLAVFNGRGGLELPDNLRAGCAGLIPAPECADVQARIFALMSSGDAAHEAEAERLYREILPAIVFAMQSIDHLVCYGKRLLAHRLGLAVHDRTPALAPTPFGLDLMRRHAERLGRVGL